LGALKSKAQNDSINNKNNEKVDEQINQNVELHNDEF